MRQPPYATARVRNSTCRRTTRAIAQYKAAIDLDSTDAAIYGELSVLLTMTGQRAEARDYLERGFKIDASNPMLMQAQEALNRSDTSGD